ncbi:DUF4132 domain-containing protein [Streptomyces fildesensis]|uniref:DUF4132 domain-containing protein n=1 Tax=Streptomyces fildesensis TaxID=375757 RepID=A0ABW8BZW2_9ACTN
MPVHWTVRQQRVEDAAADGDMGKLAELLAENAIASADLYHRLFVAQVDVALRLPDEARLRLLGALADRYEREGDREEKRVRLMALVEMVGRGLGADPLGERRAEKLLALSRGHSYWHADRMEILAEAELAAGRTLAPEVVAVFRRASTESYQHQGLAVLAAKLTEPAVNPGEAWADRAIAELPALDASWTALLRHATTATASKPTAKWEKAARSLIASIGPDAVRGTALPWLALVGRPRTQPLERRQYEADINSAYDPYNANALRGLAWILSFLPSHPDIVRALGALVETSLRKVAGIGPRNPKVANAGVVALSRIEGEAALAELSRLATRVTYKNTLKLLDTALEERAAVLGLSRDEIEELAVPAYGLTEVGRSVQLVGGTTAELSVDGSKARLVWRNAAGKEVRSVPAAVRRDHPEELKELKAAVKDLDKMLSAQAERLDRQFLAQRSWPYTAWRERYLDHPLVGTLARRLLWIVDGETCGFAEGALRTLSGTEVAAGPASSVELWHPIGQDPAAVVAWREWLERHAVTQPFKQAHREVYLLTDAERNTGVYSNRFAAHVLRQHQFHALAAARGWRNKLRMAVDDEYPPAVRELPKWGLRAEFWVEGIGGDGENWDLDMTDSGSYLRIGTDQVRFYPLDAPENSAHAGGGSYSMWLPDGAAPVRPLPLAEIPALVLSEVLRDTDLFVGVASVGNDPTWQDGGPGGRFREYWTSYGFGELNQSAEGRRDLLTRLLPRLAIGGRCTIQGRFLHVKGALHTYRIHLGSGNILMTPNDTYLCIVPKSAAVTGTEGSYLPYEGDRTLAVILSKAMMLAHDTAITDPTIISQL